MIAKVVGLNQATVQRIIKRTKEKSDISITPFVENRIIHLDT